MGAIIFLLVCILAVMAFGPMSLWLIGGFIVLGCVLAFGWEAIKLLAKGLFFGSIALASRLTSPEAR
jgi:hypothetical protein